VLASAVEDGTGRAAALGPFAVAGKTGTVRIASGGRYRQGAYYASFAGFFPAEDPQLVIIVKLDEPQGQYYGGATAAPVTRATLEAALAARNTPLDRSNMVKPAARPPANALQPDMFVAAGTAAGASAALLPRKVVLLDGALLPPPLATTDVAMDVGEQAVPDVTGMPMRDGVRRLHAAGFRLRVEGSGRITATHPEPGSVARPSAVVRVIGEGSS
jgi:hypothetical protein